MKKQIKEKDTKVVSKKMLLDTSSLMQENKMTLDSARKTNNNMLAQLKDNMTKELRQLKVNESKKYQFKKDEIHLPLAPHLR